LRMRTRSWRLFTQRACRFDRSASLPKL